MFKVGNYPKGSDLSLINTIYHYPSRQLDGSYSLDAIDLIIKDNATGTKFLETIEQPEYDYYMINPDIYVDHNLFFTEMENVTKVTTPYTNLLRDIAERTDNMNFFMDNIHNNNRYNNTRLHMIPRVMGSDQHIEDHYRWKFSDMYNNELPSELDKAYFDIEADTRTMKGDFVEPGECPINAISLIDSKYQTVDCYILRDRENPLCKEFEDQYGTMISKVKNFVIDTLGEAKAKKYKVDTLNYDFHFFEKEIDLLIAFFDKVNTIRPDFMLAWNMAFDIPYIIQRIKNLGFSPEDIMCDADFKYKRASYYIDERNKDDFAQRGDFATISAYPTYLDQLIHFASRRKGSSAIANYRLDYIGEITCGVKKLDWKYICSQLQDLPQENFEVFIFYNIMDTIVQYCIENKVNDIGNALNNVLLNNTRYPKVYRQTIYLKNRAFKSFYKKGLIMGNNCNKDTPKTRFPGAWVSNPLFANDHSKLKVQGKAINIFDNLDDFDYKSLYPSITSEFNISMNTMIARLNIPNKVYDKENRFGRESFKYKREGQFMEDLQSHVWLEFFHRWFNFASYSEMYDDVIEYYSRKVRPNGILDIHLENGKLPVMVPVPHTKKINPFITVKSEDDKKKINGHFDYNYKPFNFKKYGVDSFDNLYNNIQELGDDCYDRKKNGLIVKGN